jgi:hypothetical protein
MNSGESIDAKNLVRRLHQNDANVQHINEQIARNTCMSDQKDCIRAHLLS